MRIIDWEGCNAGTSLPLHLELWPNKVRFLMEDGQLHVVEADLGPGYWIRIKKALESLVGETTIEDWPETLHLALKERTNE